MKIPHDWQFNVISEIDKAWEQHNNVLLRADTGAGKTVMLSWVVRNHNGPSCVIAHRDRLVEQISNALAAQGIYHDLVASEKTRRAIAREHVEIFGRCFYRPGAPCKVASIDTLRKAKGLAAWGATVTLVVVDEAHHVVRDNKWGDPLNTLFTHAYRKLLLPTATPRRADGKGLGSHADGYADVMVQAPPMRWLIDNGYLTDYDVMCPTSDLVIAEDARGSEGDYSPAQLREAAKRSHIVGDVVKHYTASYAKPGGGTFTPHGMRTVTFCTDVDTANETATAFNLAGVPCAVLTGDTESGLRRKIIQRLETGALLNICAVDIISEGFDLPAIECVIMARPTQSLALYMQQFGRALRVMLGKARALIIDCVSNFIKPDFGPPDRPRSWSLDRRDKRASTAADDVIPYRPCPECTRPYERIYRACPFCGFAPEPAGRGSPAQVDGDVGLLDPAVLAAMRGAIEQVDANIHAERARLMARHVPQIGIGAALKRHMATQTAQAKLRDVMARWAGTYHHAGESDSAINRRFFLTYGVDTYSAMALGERDADALREAIDGSVISG